MLKKNGIFGIVLSIMLCILSICSQYTNIVLISLEYNHVYSANVTISENFIETFNDVCTNELLGNPMVQAVKSDVSSDNGIVIGLQAFHIYLAILPKDFHTLVYNSFRKEERDVTFHSVIIYYIHDKDGKN